VVLQVTAGKLYIGASDDPFTELGTWTRLQSLSLEHSLIDFENKYVGNLIHFKMTYKTMQDADWGSRVLRNVGILPQYYTASQPED
jgi:hypothetical protein